MIINRQVLSLLKRKQNTKSIKWKQQSKICRIGNLQQLFKNINFSFHSHHKPLINKSNFLIKNKYFIYDEKQIVLKKDSITERNKSYQKLRLSNRQKYQRLKSMSQQDLQKQIIHWSKKCQQYMHEIIDQNHFDIEHQNKNSLNNDNTTKNSATPINVINFLIIALKTYHQKRYIFIQQHKTNNLKTISISHHNNISRQLNLNHHHLHINQFLIKSHNIVISFLHLIISSQYFNINFYTSNVSVDNNKHAQQQYPFVGTFIKMITEILEFNIMCEQQSQQYKTSICSIIQLIDLYVSSYLNMIKDPLQHLYVYDSMSSLIKLGVGYGSRQVNRLIHDKYTTQHMIKNDRYNKSEPTPAIMLYHKSFLQNKSNKSSKSNKSNNKFQYKYNYSDFDQAYIKFVKDQILQRVIKPDIQAFINNKICEQINAHINNEDLLDSNQRKQDNSLYLIKFKKYINLYIQWIRLFILYQQVNQNKTIIIETFYNIQYLINLIKEYIVDITKKQSHNKLSEDIYLNDQIYQNLLYLKYFYLHLIQTVYNNLHFIQIVYNSSDQFLTYKKDCGQDNHREILKIGYQFINTIQKSLSNLQSNNLIHIIIIPKIQCLKLQIRFKYLWLRDNQHQQQQQSGNLKLNLSIKKFIFHQVQATLQSQIYLSFPYLYLTWFYQRSNQLINKLSSLISNNQNKQIIYTLRLNVLQKCICSIGCFEYNRLSRINKILSIIPMFKQIKYLEQWALLLFKSQQTTKFNHLHLQICNWLCSHSRQQLLTQHQQDICDVLEYFLQKKQIYQPFFTKIVEISFGQFKWESFNKLYYLSIFYYQHLHYNLNNLNHLNNSSSIVKQSNSKKHYYQRSNNKQQTINQDQIKQQQDNPKLTNIQYVRRYILNEYNAMGINRRQIPTSSYFYKIVEIETTQKFYKNYFENFGKH